jgi:hypothetical protein
MTRREMTDEGVSSTPLSSRHLCASAPLLQLACVRKAIQVTGLNLAVMQCNHNQDRHGSQTQ